MSHVPAFVCYLAASLMCGLCAMQLFVPALFAAVVFDVYLLVILRVRDVRTLRVIGGSTLVALGLVLALAYDWTPG